MAGAEARGRAAGRLRRVLAGVFAAWVGSGTLSARELAADEQVLFVPGTARALGTDRIELDVHAWIYEREERPRLASAFARYLGFDRAAASAEERERFEQRTRLFLVDSENRKRIALHLADGSRVELPRTRRGGRSDARVTMAAAGRAPGAQWIGFSVDLPPGDARRFEGRALYVPAEGLSVVSDIDDTIKDSGVADRRTLLLNTFVRPFAAVPGMAARYRALAAADGVRFHYVSSSPIQLLAPLLAFLEEAGFPEGSVHLREATAWRTLIPREASAQARKRAAIARLIADFPHRDFALVGDASEADPEIYGAIARDHPAQICAILIRDASGAGRETPRYRSAFAGLPDERWQIFGDEDDWGAVLEGCAQRVRGAGDARQAVAR
ncbi:MAG TPA: App1 family protein [Dokdonella sp.]|uniref:phosphatidate phosphatase App1 family protein n=1 Tax=Dokdonella sp. TaxID=2291710 RepID=UPI002CB2680F|nr:App1 family protein [Dokdonella sp.]HUD40964.1 App1 family protein [Dokdonella sp.]